MNDSNIVSLSDVGKCYVKYDDVPSLVTGVRHLLKRGRRGRLWAVRHLNLEVGAGEAVGIIGRNGSGKSTTLSMMAGVTAPTEGIVRVRGRLAPLLRLGVGFEQELTGRENVYINGMILGMGRKEIDRKFDDIVSFAEMENFIDTPVKFYSSGMLVRLGFASAVWSDPQLLIVDEVLSVGDVAFQARSFDRMFELREQGTTLVVVTHNMQSVRRLAERVIVLHDGEVRFQGSTGDAISKYHELLREYVVPKGAQHSDTGVEIVAFELYDEGGNETSHVSSDERSTFCIRVRFTGPIEQGQFGLAISTESGQYVFGESSFGLGPLSAQAGDEKTYSISVPMKLVSGSYIATGTVRWGSVVKHNVNTPPKVFYVSGRPMVRGLADLGATFDIVDHASRASDVDQR